MAIVVAKPATDRPRDTSDMRAQVFQAILSRIRNDDVVARMGENEFTVLLRGASIEDAPRIAARLRDEADRVSDLPVSFGFAALDGESDSVPSAIDEVLDLARPSSGSRSGVVSKVGGPVAWFDISEVGRRQQSEPPSQGACQVGRRRKDARAASPLTQRQLDVLHGLAEGKSTDQIAGDLFLSPVTVRNHVAGVLAALGVRSRLQAVLAAKRRGLIA